MTKTKEDSLQAKAAKGIYTLVEPLDYLILQALPDQGELAMGYYPMVMSAKQLSKDVFQGNLSPLQLSGDIRRLTVQGLAIKVGGRGSGGSTSSGYQRTPKGKELVEKWNKNQGGAK